MVIFDHFSAGHLGKIGHFSAKIPENGRKSAILPKWPILPPKSAILTFRYRFFPKVHMGWIKIQNVFFNICPPVYLNRMTEWQNPLKLGSKWQKIGSKTGKNSPF